MNPRLRRTACNGVDNVLEIANRIKLLVHAGKADISHGINLEELGKNLVANLGGRRFILELLK